MNNRMALTGWGNALTALTQLYEPKTQSEFQELLGHADQRGVLATGLQRSYGDSTLNSGGMSLSTRALKECVIDIETGIVIAGAGLSIRELEVQALENKFFPPVVPGTGFVTLGGALAADIHSKSHHVTGSFSAAVRRIELLYSDGSIKNLFPQGPTSNHFWATVGGLGLTGIILRIELQLISVVNDLVNVNEVRCRDLDLLMNEIKDANKEFAHTVAWIDLSHDYRGRGLVSKANYSDESTSKSKKINLDREGTKFPSIGGKNLINSQTVRIFNEAWFRKPVARGTLPLTKYMHPLDGVGDWNRIYGVEGFLQYQFVIPNGSEELLPRILEELKKRGIASFLGVLKYFGVGNSAIMSFPLGGWTLAMDFPIGIEGLEALLNKFDDWVLGAGGRVYLIKDSRLRPEYVPLMYPKHKEWQEVRNEMDPLRLWCSDQSRRLELC
jgi:FAD/FMN-containing dehydrogenase